MGQISCGFTKEELCRKHAGQKGDFFFVLSEIRAHYFYVMCNSDYIIIGNHELSAIITLFKVYL
jgi:hypothetical protein